MMFRTAELGRTLSKKAYKEQEIYLRQELLKAQQAVRSFGNFPVIILFAGVDGAGKGDTVNLLNAWMDPRWLVNHAYGVASDEESERPEYWRFWRDLPPKGQMGLFLSSWYSRPVLDKVYDKVNNAQFDEQLDHIINFENALANDGALIIKFWMHLSKAEQKMRFQHLEKDPLLSWQVTEKDWEHWHKYKAFTNAAERTIMRTSTGKAPWSIVEGVDINYRRVTVAHSILESINKHLQEAELKQKLKQQLREQQREEQQALKEQLKKKSKSKQDKNKTEKSSKVLTVLNTLDLTKQLDKEDYKKQLKEYQAKLGILQRQAQEQKISTLLVFEGADAAGKGGAIRRLTSAMDARNYLVIPIAAPTDEERAQHYLWRFWRHLPRAGRVTIFDRSWYGRVLVERVEGFALENEWRRAYSEINNFEEQLGEGNIVVLKFWIHIDKDEQLSRFKLREKTPHKRWKLTEEDWRNREKWDEYDMAVNDLVERTSTRNAPWILVEGNDKLYARIKVLKTVCKHLSQALERQTAN